MGRQQLYPREHAIHNVLVLGQTAILPMSIPNCRYAYSFHDCVSFSTDCPTSVSLPCCLLVSVQGGSVKGRRVHGVYPEDLNPETSDLEVGRGRGVFIPTTPWYGPDSCTWPRLIYLPACAYACVFVGTGRECGTDWRSGSVSRRTECSTWCRTQLIFPIVRCTAKMSCSTKLSNGMPILWRA